MTYIVERIEEDMAVLQNHNEEEQIVPLTDLPPVKAGDVLLFENGAYTVKESETAARKSRILALQNRLRKK